MSKPIDRTKKTDFIIEKSNCFLVVNNQSSITSKITMLVFSAAKNISKEKSIYIINK